MKKVFPFLILAVLTVLSVPSVEAGKQWVSNNETFWTIEQTCVNGAELIIVSDKAVDPDALMMTIDVSVAPRLIGHNQYGWSDEVEDISGNFNAYEFGYYPDISGIHEFVELPKQAEPFIVSVTGDPEDTAEYDYYLKTNIRFFEDVKVGDWALYLGDVEIAYVDKAENCRIDELPSSTSDLLYHILPYEIPAFYQADNAFKEEPIYLAEQISGDVDLYRILDSVPTVLMEGDRFSIGELGTGDSGQILYESHSAGPQTAVLSVQFTTLVSNGNGVGSSGAYPAISADGQRVVFESADGVILNRLDSPIKEIGAISPDGQRADISPDGDYIAFTSNNQNLETNPIFDPCEIGKKSNTSSDVFIYNNPDSSMQRRAVFNYPSSGCVEIEQDSSNVSIAEASPFPVVDRTIDSGGTAYFVFNTSYSFPITETVDTNDDSDVILGIDEPPYSQLLSRNSMNQTGNKFSDHPSISADGYSVAFQTAATDLFVGDTNEKADIVVSDNGSPDLEVVSVSSAELLSDGDSFNPAVSRFGETIVFESDGTNLTSADNQSYFQIYARDRLAGCTVPISINQAGQMGNSGSYNATVSADGRYVAFHSFATNLLGGADAAFAHIYLADRDADGDGSFYADEANCIPGPSSLQLVSVASDGTPANGSSIYADISNNGRFVTFQSVATNLVESDTTTDSDVYLRYIGPKIKLKFGEDPLPEPTQTPTITVTPTSTATPIPTPTLSATPPNPTEMFIFLPMIDQ
ncbi:MAG: TolB family protein [Anaerolineae bacterium]